MATLNYNLTQTGQQVKDDLDQIESGDLIYYTTVPGVNNSNTKIRIVVTTTEPESPSAGYLYLITSPDASTATGLQFSFADKRVLKIIFDTEEIDHLSFDNVVVWEAGSTTLIAPSISLSGTIVTITDVDGRATEFDVYADDTFKFTISATDPGAGAIFDVNALELGSGMHTIKTKAKATGLATSDFSNSITYILNEDIILDTFELDAAHPYVVFVYDA